MAKKKKKTTTVTTTSTAPKQGLAVSDKDPSARKYDGKKDVPLAKEAVKKDAKEAPMTFFKFVERVKGVHVKLESKDPKVVEAAQKEMKHLRQEARKGNKYFKT